jgi:amidohydrolase
LLKYSNFQGDLKKMNVRELSEKYKEELIALRREFHKNPELGWEEIRTGKRVEEELKKIGIGIERVAKTGIVGTLKGREGGKVVALRADMDALPIEEANNDIPYKSKNKGVMHACGHDGHTAMLLIAAKVLWELRDQIKGTVKFIFQPAEEPIQGGKMMLDEGVMEGVDAILGIHIWSQLPTGKVSLEPGPRFAAGDRFKITVKGKGSHGAVPHLGVDAIVVASAIVMNLQTIVSREIDPLEPVVVSIGTINGGFNFNVICNEVVLEGTTRSFNQDIQNRFPDRIRRIVDDVASSFNAKAEVDYTIGSLSCINHPALSQIAKAGITKLYGEDVVINFEKIMGGEDFAYLIQTVPGIIVFLGGGNKAKNTTYPHHHEKFNIDEDALPIGTSLYAQFALDFLNKK